eukprot:Sdes_comp8798_c0_seq2m179
MSLEKVERIMDDTREAIEYQNEISEILSGKLTQEDDDAILQELEELVQQETVASLRFPDVPLEAPPLQTDSRDAAHAQGVPLDSSGRDPKNKKRELVAA